MTNKEKDKNKKSQILHCVTIEYNPPTSKVYHYEEYCSRCKQVTKSELVNSSDSYLVYCSICHRFLEQIWKDNYESQ